MTAEDFVDLVQAHRASPTLWIRKCPAHDDRGQALSIRNGRDGAVQFHCGAGCTFYETVEAFEFDYIEINSRPSPTPDLVHMNAPQREAYEQAERARQVAHVAACDRIRELSTLSDRLGKLLARRPDGSERTELVKRSITVQQRLSRAEEKERSLRK